MIEIATIFFGVLAFFFLTCVFVKLFCGGTEDSGAAAAPARLFKHPWVFDELLPRGMGDDEGSHICLLSVLASLPDDSIGYEALHDAVVEAKRLGAGFTPYVAPENLLFVFGHRTKALCDAESLFPVAVPCGDPRGNRPCDRCKRPGYGGEQPDPQSRAMVFCKLRNPESFAQLLAAQDEGCEKEHGAKAGYSLVSWEELDKLKHRLDERIAHDKASRGVSND